MIRRFLNRVPAGAWWMLYSYVLGFGVQGAYVLVLARTLGAEQYGLFSGALALVTMLSALAGIGAGNVLVMRTARDRSRYAPQLATAITYVFISLPFLALLAIMLTRGSERGMLAILAPLIVSELIFLRFFEFGLQSFQSHGQLRHVAHFNVIASTARLVLVAGFAQLGGGSAAQWSWLYAIVNVAMSLAILAICFRRFGRPTIDRESLKSTWRIGAFFSLGMASRTLVNDADKFILANSGLAADGGQYTASHRLVNMAFAPVQAITYSSNAEWFRAGAHGYAAVWVPVRKVLPLVLGYVVLAIAGLQLVPPVAVWILGEDFEGIARMMPLLSFILLGQALYTVFGDALMGVGRQSVRSITQMAVGVAVAIANILCIPIWGWKASAVIAITASLVLGGTLALIFLSGLRRERRESAQ